MFLASKAVWAGIVFILLTTGISEPRRRRSLREPTAKKCQRSGPFQADNHTLKELVMSARGLRYRKASIG